MAVAILGLLLTVFLSISEYASRAWKGSQEKMEEFSTARVVLGRMRADIESIVFREDLPLFPKNGTASEIGFMTAKHGAMANASDVPRLLSYVEYTWNGTTAELNRSNRAYKIDESPPFSNAVPVPAPAGLNTSVLARGIVGYQPAFLNDDGTWSQEFHPQPRINPTDPEDPVHSIALRVSLLIVSSDGLKYLDSLSGSELSTLAGAMKLSDTEATDKDESPVMKWNAKIEGGSSSIDKRMARTLRGFERLFYFQGVLGNAP